jgi:hypothetical protein
MSTARVEDIEILKVFRAAMFKFAEASGVALADAESELHRTINWLENEQMSKWQNEHRKRQRILGEAREKLRMKKVFAGPAGTKQSTVDEEKLVKIATAKVLEAEQKILACKKWNRQLQKEMLMYKGQTQRFATAISVDIPLGAAVLGNMIVRLEAYASLAPQNASSAVSSSDASMTKDVGEEGPSLADVLQRLRDSTPGTPDRAGAAVEPIDLTKGSAERISDADRALIQSLAPAGPAEMDDSATMVISTATVGKPRVYLQRLGSSKPGDTGWYLAPAEVGANPFNVTVPMTDVLRARPDWLEIFSLPLGTLVVVDGGVVAAILTFEGKDLWAEATMAKLSAELADEPAAEAEAEATAEGQAAAETPVEATAEAATASTGESDGRS